MSLQESEKLFFDILLHVLMNLNMVFKFPSSKFIIWLDHFTSTLSFNGNIIETEALQKSWKCKFQEFGNQTSK